MKHVTCPTDHDLSQFDLGDLAGQRYEEISLHLESCTECARRFETLQVRADGVIEGLRQELPREAIEEDAELRRLMDAASAVEITSLTADADTQPGRKAGRVTQEQLAAQILAPPLAEGVLGRLGGYRVLEMLGAGGMGVVFKAEDPSLKRLVALKAMQPYVVAAHQTARERFLREAQTTAAIQHDNIVTIHQVGQDGDVAFLAMQLLSGESLAKRLAREPQLPIADVLQIGRETAQGLAAAHAKGLTHRDIKPDNLWLESPHAPLEEPHAEREDYRVKILDFGLARAVDDGHELTNSGTVVGTPSYLAPEQARGKHVDARADLFSLGVVMYQMLAGTKPFARENLSATLLAILSDDPPPLHELRQDVPPALAELVMRLLSKDAAQRPASAHEVVRSIRTLEANFKTEIANLRPEISRLADSLSAAVPPRSRIRIALAVGAAALALLAGVIVIIRHKQGNEIARMEASEGTTVEVQPVESLRPKPPSPVSSTSTDYLPPISSIALVQRPAKLVSKDGSEPVVSWTVATVPALGSSASIPVGALNVAGTRLATFGDDGLVRIFDLDLQRLEKVLVGHGAGVAYNSVNKRWERANSRHFGPIAWQPGTSLLATVSRDGELRVWDTETGRVVFQVASSANDPNFLAWSPDGNQLAVGYSLSRVVRLWNTLDWNELKQVDGLPAACLSLNWSPDSKMLAIGAKVVMLYSPPVAKLQVLESATESPGHMSSIAAVRWSPDSSRLAHLQGGLVAIRDAKTLQRLRELRHTTAGTAPQDFAWSPDGKHLLVGWRSGNKNVQTVHDSETGVTTNSLEVANELVYRNYIEWLPDGRTVVLGAKLVDLETQKLLGEFSHCSDLSDDGKRLLVYKPNYSSPFVIRLEEPGQVPQTLYQAAQGGSPTYYPPVWSPDGRYIKLGTVGDKTFVKCDDTGAFGRFVLTKRNIDSWSPNNTFVFEYMLAGTPSLSSWPSEELVREFELPFHVGQHRWSPDATKIAMSKGNEMAIAILDTSTGEIVTTFQLPSSFGKTGSVLSLDWSGDRLAVGAPSGMVGLFSASEGILLQTLEGGGTGAHLRFLPGGRQVLRLANDAVFLYDATDGRMLRKFPVGVTTDAIHIIDDATVLGASPDGSVNRLNLSTGLSDKLCHFEGEAKLFSPDGRYLTCDLAHARRIVRVADGELLAATTGFQTLVSPDGHLLNQHRASGVAWVASPGVKDKFVYIVQTARGQQTLTPQEFANRYGWRNDPGKVQLNRDP